MATTYATWDSGNKGNLTLSGGDLTFTGGTPVSYVFSTIGLTTGSWYWETLRSGAGVGFIGIAYTGETSYLDTNTWTYYSYNGYKRHGGTTSSYGSSYASTDYIGVALNIDAGKIWFCKNGVWQGGGDPAAGTGEAFSGITGTVYAVVYGASVNHNGTTNFGASGFQYACPDGFFEGFATIDTGIDATLPVPDVFLMQHYFHITLPMLEMETAAASLAVDTYDSAMPHPQPQVTLITEPPVSAVLEQTLPSFSMEAGGNHRIEATLPSLEVDIEAQHKIIADISAKLSRIAVSMWSGWKIAATLPSLSVSIEALKTQPADMEIFLPLLSMEATGNVPTEYEISDELPMILVAMTSPASNHATLAASLSMFTFEIDGFYDLEADIDIDLPSMALILSASHAGRFDSYSLSYDADDCGCS